MTDLDPMLHEAMARVRGPLNTRPSLTDVRRRARRRNRRRMSATVGVVACAGVATTALVIRRDGMAPRSVASPADSTLAGAEMPTTSYLMLNQTTTTYQLSPWTVSPGVVWDALRIAQSDPSGALLPLPSVDDIATRDMPTAEQFGCAAPECQSMFTYLVWHGIASMIGFGDVIEMQAANPNIDFSVPPVEGAVLQPPYSTQVVPPDANGNETPTTISMFDGVVLIDGGAPAGAMEDAYQRLAGYNRTIITGTAVAQQTMLMPIGDHALMATSIGNVLGIDGLDTWNPAFAADPIEGMVAVIVGPDYWDRVGQPTATSSTVVATTSLP